MVNILKLSQICDHNYTAHVFYGLVQIAIVALKMCLGPDPNGFSVNYGNS